MKIFKYSLLLAFAAVFNYCFAQTPQQIYRKPLSEVLSSVAGNYHVKIIYPGIKAEKINVDYSSWRASTDLNNTLHKILLPLDLGFEQLNDSTIRITRYEYYRRPEEEGEKELERLLATYKNAEEFDRRKEYLKNCLLTTTGINLSRARPALNSIHTSKRKMNGYTVENIAFESFPGYFVTGNLYMPAKIKGNAPVILCPHGHFYGKDNSVDDDSAGRFRADMQYRCAMLARMGAIVFGYDMYSWGESLLQTGSAASHENGEVMPIQTWNSIRVVDFLLSLPNADKNKVGVTGASGGGTQTILVSALDDRVKASAPIVMVSSCFYGGCPCESGLPIHDACGKQRTNNVEIAALTCPRPQLLVSDGNDWTRTVPKFDFAYLQKIYGYYGKEADIRNVHLPNDEHDYGYTKRVPMYNFFADSFGLNLENIKDKQGIIDESTCKLLSNKELRVFAKQQLPEQAVTGHENIVKSFKEFFATTGSH